MSIDLPSPDILNFRLHGFYGSHGFHGIYGIPLFPWNELAIQKNENLGVHKNIGCAKKPESINKCRGIDPIASRTA